MNAKIIPFKVVKKQRIARPVTRTEYDEMRHLEDLGMIGGKHLYRVGARVLSEQELVWRGVKKPDGYRRSFSNGVGQGNIWASRLRQ